jgi:hypothetical protein
VNRVLIALTAALVLAIASAGSASATIYQHQTGIIGPWSWNDTSASPGVLCKYGQSADNNHYPMTKIVVQPPTVYAADRNSNKIEKRTISWRFQLQRKLLPDGKWKTLAKASGVQKATATENSPASFSPITLKHVPKNASADGWIVRVQVLIKWIVPGTGAVEGTMLFRPSYYHAVSPGFDFVGSRPYCGEVQTTG